MLRCVFRWKGLREPVMIVGKEINLPIYTENEGPEIDIETEPWKLVISIDKRNLKFHYSHIIMDGWSLGVFFDQLFLLYQNGEMAGKTSVNQSIKRYVLAMKKMDFTKTETFWSIYWKDYKPLLLLDSMIVSKNVCNEKYKGIMESLQFEKLEEYAAKYSLTVSNICYGAWAVLLSAFVRSDDVCFGFISSGRSNEWVELDSIGMHIKNLPLRVSTKEGFVEICKVISKTVIETMQYENCSNQCMYGSTGYTQRQKLYDSLFVVENYPLDIQAISEKSELDIVKYKFHEDSSYPVVIQIQLKDRMELELSGNEHVSSLQLQILGQCYLSLLKQIVDNSLNDVKDMVICGNFLDTIKKNEKSWNMSEAGLDLNLAQIIIEAGKRYSEHTAIIDGDMKWSYKQLVDICKTGSRVLNSMGIMQGIPVGVYMGRSASMLSTVYSILLAGGVYLPISLSVPEKRIHYMVENAKVMVIVCENSKDKEKLQQMSLGARILEYSELSKDIATVPDSEYSNETTAYILYTSGTTGNPKGVEISHKSILNRLIWNSKEIGVHEKDIQLFKTPVSFDVSVIEILQIFFNGHTVVVLSEKYEKMPNKIVEYLEKYQVTYLHFVPTMFTQFTHYISAMGQQACLKSVEKIVCSGEILYADMVNLFYTQEGSERIKVINLYGPTEAAVDVSSFICEDEQKEDIIPIGKPIYNTELRILDHRQRRVPPYVVGELYILGTNLGKGYINNPEKTMELFKITSNNERCYDSGDLAYWNENGDVIVIGRKDSQVKFNGVRIECEEIRTHLINSKIVKDTVVILKKESPEKLILFYTGKELKGEQIKDVLLKKMPEYMLPSDYCYIEEFPYLLSGKTDRNKLLQYFLQINSINIVSSDRYTELTETEKRLSEIWKNILGTHNTFDSDSDFFRSGGTSLLIISMITSIKKEFDVTISTEQVYNKLVLGQLASLIEQSCKLKDQYYDDILEESINYAQRGMASMQLMNRKSTAYNIPILMKLKEGVNSSKVGAALNELIKEVTYLRTVFEVENDKLISKTLRYEEFVFHKVRVPKDKLEEYVNDFIRPFELDKWLFRVEFVYTDCNEIYMIFDIHHILCDQGTLKLLMQNFERILNGKNSFPLTLKEKSKVKITDKEMHKEYWTLLFENGREGSLLPIDLQNTLENEELKCYKFSFDMETRNQIAKYSREKGTTPFNVLFTAYVILTAMLTKKNDIIIGTNYIKQDDMNSIGMYLQIIPMKISINRDYNYTLEEILKQFITRFKEAITYNTYSYGELLQDMKLYTNSGRNPLFEMMFVREEDYFYDSGLQNFFESISMLNQSAKFDLSLFYHECDSGINFSFDFNANVYLESTIEFYAQAYNMIIDAMLTDDQITLHHIDILSNETKKTYLDPSFGRLKELNNITVQAMMIKQSENFPDSVAVICGTRKITYGEFNEMTNRIAHALEEYKVENQFVLLSMDNSELLLAAIYGVLKAGGVYLPIDNSFTESRYNYIIENSNVALVITDHKHKTYQSIKAVNIHTLLTCEKTYPICKGTISDNAYCIYTSGSTGNPKGCVIHQKGLVNYIDWANDFYCGGKKKVFAYYTSPAVDMSVTSTILPLACGHTIIVYSNQSDSILKVVMDNRINIVKATPSHLALIRNDMQVAESIETFIVGGEKLTTKIAQETYNKFNKNVHIFNEYGPTETVVGCMIYEYNERNPFSTVPIGSPIQNMFTVIIDKNGKICPPYMEGELYIGGCGVIDGYWNKEEITSDKFIANNIDDQYSQTMYASGDIARVIGKGIIEYIGRNDNQVKINGRRIELDEITVAAGKLACVSQAAVVLAQGKNGNNNIILYYVRKANKSWSENEIRNKLGKVLPYYMMPLRIVELKEMPMATSGKTDLKRLESMEPEYEEINASTQDIKAFLIQCVSEIAGYNDFTEFQGFFDIGINSLSVIELHKLISQKYELEVSDLFRYPSISSLSLFLKNVKPATETEYNEKEEEYAIVGMGFQIPGAEDIDELRQILLQQKSRIVYPTGQRYDDEVNRLHIEGYHESEFKMGMTASLERVDLFATEYFNITKEEADVMDPIQRLFMVNAAKAFLDAGYTKETMNGLSGAIIGAKPTETEYTQFVEKYYPDRAKIAVINRVQPIMLSRLQHFYNLTGPSYLVDSACSSGLVALNNACNHLYNGDCNIALVGGVNLVQIADVKVMKRAEVLSANYHANTFSDNANGTARGEGCICYVIKRLTDAVNDGSKIYAVIKGSSINNDGFSSSLTAPNGLAQKKLIQDALNKCKIQAEEIGMIETHGTATTLGDPIEIQALTEAYGMSTDNKQYCALSASKAIFGHMDSLAGLMGILKCIVSLQYKELYPNFQITAPNRRIDFIKSPFYLPVSVQKWKANSNNTRICGINSFGLSGTNVHVLLQQWPVESNEIGTCKQIKDFGMEMKRCWIEGNPTCDFITTRRTEEKENRIVSSRAELLSTLFDKVQRLFPNILVETNASLYSLGFDSITIIQLQQFINSQYGINIEIEFFFEQLNSLNHLADYIFDRIKQRKVTDKKNKNFNTEQLESRIISRNSAMRNTDTTPDIISYQLRAFINEFAPTYFKKTSKSYSMMHQDKIHWANGRFISGNTKDMECMSYPIIVNKAQGTRIWDIDGNEYLDFAMGFGANFFGYNNEEIRDSVITSLENDIVLGAIRPEAFEVAEKISKMTGMDRVSFCNSGSEAVMNLLRIARAVTNRNKVIAFEGSFHGTFDPIFTQPNEMGGEHALPKSIGTPLEFVSQTFLFPYGGEEVFDYLENEGDEIAAVIIEPIQSRHPDLQPVEFVQKIRKVTEEKGIILIFDEVITGFRSGIAGAQKHFGIQADLVSYGKVIGGGFPMGIFAGKSKYMDIIDHKGWSPVSHKAGSAYLVNTGGTFNAHPASIAAALAVLNILERNGDEIYTKVNSFTKYLAGELNQWFKEHNINICVEYFCSQFIFVSKNVKLLRLLQYLMIFNNIYVWEGGTCFICTEHTREDVDRLIHTVKDCCMTISDIFYNDNSEIKVSKHVSLDGYDRIYKKIKEEENIEKIYPLTKQQMSILATNLNNRDKKLDVSYMQFTLNNSINQENFTASFYKVVNSYEALRCKWCWRGLKEPIVMLMKSVSPDVKYYKMEEYNEKTITGILENRKEIGFSLDSSPYMAMDVIRYHNKECNKEVTRVLLTYYTSVIDGWSMDMFLNTFLSIYYGDKTEYKGFNYEDYLDWLYNKDVHNETKEYWIEYFKDISFDTVETTAQVGNLSMASYEWTLDDHICYRINETSRWNDVSKASIIAYCFGKAIGVSENYSLIASTVTGRNMNLDGMMQACGMFSNIVPLKVNCSINSYDGIKALDKDFKHINKLLPFTSDEIAEIININPIYLRNVIYNGTIVFLNQMGGSKWNDIEIVEDHGYIAIPLRWYVNFGERISILVTYAKNKIKTEEMKDLKQDFINNLMLL